MMIFYAFKLLKDSHSVSLSEQVCYGLSSLMQFILFHECSKNAALSFSLIFYFLFAILHKKRTQKRKKIREKRYHVYA